MKRPIWLKLFNFWPPFLGAGIRVKTIAPDFLYGEVVLKERFWNRNMNGSHYGGSIFSMTDPIYAVMLKFRLGRDYIVWDKEATIRFKKPGKGTLRAVAKMSAEEVDTIRDKADVDGKAEPEFIVSVTDESGDVVAEVDKIVHVRRKDSVKREA